MLMEDIQIKSDLVEQLIEISKEAGKAILEIYNTNFDYQIKEDLSPLTKADILSHNIICQRLKVLTPDIPILSEENSDIPFNIRSLWKQYWLVDPLDGTKEFIKRNGEFTVNIALIENNIPIFGVIYIPVSNEIYWGLENDGSYYQKNIHEKKRIQVSEINNRTLRIITSRSHENKLPHSFLDQMDNVEIINKGSSLKFCLIASGEADIYPRLGLTSEWDTAAGEAIVKFAGGQVVTTNGEQILYNKNSSFINPQFIVSSDNQLIRKFVDSLKD